eukprot:TRINITY_DN8450_c0_g1_i4.p1 TRINITY_DN8450_c0_g1~~TRINITY_DN8450_c0_g1_i4.p1  ORF type:complete len:183 (-),score=42.67 TRINITY_DN8450_c0_g1_i4:103-651(-)
MIRRPPRSTQGVSSAASDVYKRQVSTQSTWEKLEIELGELRAIAQNNAGPQNKITISSAPLINKAQLLEQQKALQKEISEFKAKKSVEVSEQMKLLSQLKQQYQTLFHNNKLNSHRILEQNRLAKPAKVRHSSVLTPRITSNNHRAEKLLKYKRMKLKNAKSVVPVVESKGFFRRRAGCANN